MGEVPAVHEVVSLGSLLGRFGYLITFLVRFVISVKMNDLVIYMYEFNLGCSVAHPYRVPVRLLLKAPSR